MICSPKTIITSKTVIDPTKMTNNDLLNNILSSLNFFSTVSFVNLGNIAIEKVDSKIKHGREYTFSAKLIKDNSPSCNLEANILSITGIV